MVSFVCDNCGNGFRKNQVESHMYQCHSRSVSCVDCSSSFGSAEFKLHIKCITESEKYEAKSSYVEKAKKGDVKQNAWYENVVAAVAGFRGSSRAKELLEKLTEFPNIPRKKAKFFNFMRNSFRSYGVHDGLLGEVWTVIESFDKKQPEKKAPEAGVKRKADTDEVAGVGKAKKLAVEVENNKKFDWIESSRLEFARKEGREMKFKKLFKKILKSYKKAEEAESSEQELAELKRKLVKKLRKQSSMFEVVANVDEQEAAEDEFSNLTVKYIV